MPAAAVAAGALLLGGGIATMHYTGMAAMKMTPGIVYSPVIVGASVAIAVAGQRGAVDPFHLRRHSARVRSYRMGAARS